MDTIPDAISAPTQKDYVQDLHVQITHILDKVNKYLQLLRRNMMSQYNKSVRYFE